MKILFRTDAGPQIGAGHAMRCCAFAQACQDAKIELLFVMAECLPAVASRLAEEQMELVMISTVSGSADDSAKTVALAGEGRYSWIVLDGYVFGADFQQALKDAGLRVLVIDDYGHATHYCADVVLNQNVYAAADLYPRRESYTRLLLGTRFVLLRREFARWKNWQRTTSSKAARILVSFGGADPVNATEKVIEALGDLPDTDLEIIAVTARPLAAPRVRIERNVTHMDELMAWADVAIAAAGTTSWELAYMQTPQIVMPIADNQLPVAAGLAAAGAAVNAGWHADVTPEHLRTEVLALLPDPTRRQNMGEAGRRLVDGEGAARVLLHLRSKDVGLRAVQADDCRLIWEWANAPEVRAASFSSEPISWENHGRWFEAKLADARCRFFVMTNLSGEPVGQVRFDIENDEAVISISMEGRARGSGQGSAAILRATQELFRQSSVRTVHAYIKPDNAASLRAFARAGFVPAAGNDSSAHLIGWRDDFVEYEAA